MPKKHDRGNCWCGSSSWGPESVKQEFKWRSCTRKHRYGQQESREIAEKLRFRLDGIPIAYECGYCRQWHVGHSTAQEIKDATNEVFVPVRYQELVGIKE